MKYVVYMEMWHNHVDGNRLLMRLRVFEAETYDGARTARNRIENTDAMSDVLSRMGRDVMYINQQANAIQTKFVIVAE